MTSSFTYEWIKYTNIVQRTGICLTFQYKMNGNNNTLALYLKSFSGKKTLMWRLHGNHGHDWTSGAVTYWPKQDISVSYFFDGRIRLSFFECSFILLFAFFLGFFSVFVCLFVSSFVFFVCFILHVF